MKKSIYSRDQKYLIKRLREARIDVGLCQVDVARKLKRSQSYISKIESGQLQIDVVQLNKFAKLYKKDLSYFLR